MDLKPIIEKLLPLLEVEVEKIIEANCDKAVDALVMKLEELIPGSIDNLVLEAAKPELKKVVKVALLAQAEKISPLV